MNSKLEFHKSTMKTRALLLDQDLVCDHCGLETEIMYDKYGDMFISCPDVNCDGYKGKEVCYHSRNFKW